MNNRYQNIIIGGGAAGLVAGISSKRSGKETLICEKLPRVGKKLLATGSGRCNLLNKNLSSDFYNIESREIVESIFSDFGKNDIEKFFKGLGLFMYTESDGRIFPITNQSSSVLSVLEAEIKNLRVECEYNFEITNILDDKEGFVVLSKSGRRIDCDNIILAGGGKSYPAFGSDGNCYRLAEKFGHTLIDPVPVGVPVVVKDQLCHYMQGQKIFASAKCLINKKEIKRSSGELIFTQYGLSGTVILDISDVISIAINRNRIKDVSVVVDMLPDVTKEELKSELLKRIKKNIQFENLLIGIMPNKMSMPLKIFYDRNNLDTLINEIKEKKFVINSTRGWNEAEFTAGGISINEIKPTLESKKRKGLYFAGEILDVVGSRGGYNLAWAWASGYVAGLTK